MKFIIAIVGCIFPHLIFAQGQHADPGLKVYTDKIIYSASDRIWFSAILTKATIADTSMPYHTMYLALIDPATQTVVQSSRFLLFNGCSAGAMEIPDTAVGKELVLLGYTNNLTRNSAEFPFIKAIAVNKVLRHLPKEQFKKRRLTSIQNSIIAHTTCDSLVYGNRTKVRCKISLRDSMNRPLKGLFSFACTTNGSVPEVVDKLNENSALSISDEYREKLNNGTNGLWNITRGRVLMVNKPFHKKMNVICYNSGKSQIVQTDPDGEFCLNMSMLYKQDTGNVYFAPVGHTRYGVISVALPTDEDRVNKLISQLPELKLEPVLIERSNEMIQEVTKIQQATQLKEIEVVENWIYHDDPFRLEPYQDIDSTCDAWVCENDVLKCTNDPLVKPAVMGHIYRQYKPGARRVSYVKYIGCRAMKYSLTVSKVRAINLPEEFPTLKDSNLSNTEPYTSSTLYWSPLIVTDDNGEAEINFYTNDLPGNFICTVRGLSTLGEFKAQTSFMVKME
ncbi:hypothetical protein [Chitinophaga sp. sic0106]|uniref:hypothetical protein n=1 Tax=Chitinophaga sp. sic0106 TaxID=2854785 RepID=UPI001C466512|nr:hypothetical protein [Chitinophaga sp. sic0106]MBV7532756.1 hypothetical protein [Chitinophaga sp. sic0106]